MEYPRSGAEQAHQPGVQVIFVLHGSKPQLFPGIAGIGPALEPPLRSEEHTSELVTNAHLVCRLLLEKKKQHNLRRNEFRPHLYITSQFLNSSYHIISNLAILRTDW